MRGTANNSSSVVDSQRIVSHLSVLYVYLAIMCLPSVFVVFILSVSTLAQPLTFTGATVTTSKPQAECRCVPAGTCGTNVIIGFDVRIVNEGGKKNDKSCPTGQVWCCEKSANLTNALCGVRKITDSPAQLIGTAKYGSYPWQAALLTDTNEYIGSGVLLNVNYVLTAAHKVAPYPKRNFKVRLGDWNSEKNTETYPFQEFEPAQVTTHPAFLISNLQNDVAIIKLNKAVPLITSPNINCAPIAATVPKPGTRCWVSGWGQNAFGPGGSYQSLMREVDVPIVDQGTCEKQMKTTRLGSFFTLDKGSFMCAGGEVGKDACTGDGGAPLVCESSGRYEVVGIVAWGIGCGVSTLPGVYVNVPNYRTWIDQQMV